MTLRHAPSEPPGSEPTGPRRHVRRRRPIRKRVLILAIIAVTAGMVAVRSSAWAAGLSVAASVLAVLDQLTGP